MVLVMGAGACKLRWKMNAHPTRQQLRQIKGSGGYQSQDASVARLGLGKDFVVASIMITWPDGEAQQLEGQKLWVVSLDAYTVRGGNQPFAVAR